MVKYPTEAYWSGVSKYSVAQWGLICVYGLPEGSQVTLSLRSPDGRLFSTQELVEVLVPKEDGGHGIPTAERYVRFSPAFPDGAWTLIVDGIGLHQETQMRVRAAGVVYGGVVVGPFAPSDPFDETAVQSFVAGEEITILGKSYPPNTRMPVGIYGLSDAADGWVVKWTQTAETDTRGNLARAVSHPDILEARRVLGCALVGGVPAYLPTVPAC